MDPEKLLAGPKERGPGSKGQLRKVAGRPPGRPTSLERNRNSPAGPQWVVDL